MPESTERKLIRAFYDQMGGEFWDRVLGSYGDDTPAGRLLAVMHDPVFASLSIERQCREAGVSFRDLVAMVSDHSLGAALIETADRAREVVASIADDAVSREYLCDLCLGLIDDGDSHTSILVDHPRALGEKLKVECPKCGGTGRRRQSGDARARETFLKLHGGLVDAPVAVIDNRSQTNVFVTAHSQQVSRGQQLLEAGRKQVASALKAGQRAIPALPGVPASPGAAVIDVPAAGIRENQPEMAQNRSNSSNSERN